MTSFGGRESPADATAFPFWQQVIADSGSVQEVVAVANEYLSRLAPRDVEMLPTPCRPRALASAADLNSYGVDLMRCATSDATANALMQHVSAFFFEAAMRVAHLSGPARDVSQAAWARKESA